ncbi:Fic family protein [uncultured Gemella sp.]|uniref:Fic family protein n=1 Tax=uncultured Gemella sp. TaxID=254352 RepID=UPI0028D1E953|nr:Fic family protein [uncultured Gemella sp.]
MLEGIKKLPIEIQNKDAIEIFKKLSSVNKKIGKLDTILRKSIVNKSILSLLTLNESVQSTRIEGTQVTFYEIMENKSKKNKSWQQTEVLNYHKAIEHGVKLIKSGDVISTRMIKELHAILMEDARGTVSNKGEFRKIQNFIGPDKKIENAVYIPINANLINEYMTNLEYFINGEYHRDFDKKVGEDKELFDHQIDSLLRIAIMHAQFESIHPFLDGNGRLGRILIVLMAIKEKIMEAPLFFVSEELEVERIRYYNTLNETRGETPSWISWIIFFLNASERMANKIIEKIETAETLASTGLNKCKTSVQSDVWLATFREPIATATDIAEITGYHKQTVKKALDYLVVNNLLDKDKSSRRNIKYYNYDLIRTIG